MNSKTIMFALGLALGGVGVCRSQPANQAAMTTSDSVRNKAALNAIAASPNSFHGIEHNTAQVAVAGGNTSGSQAATSNAQAPTNTPQVTVEATAIGVLSPQRAAQVAADIRAAAVRHRQDSIKAVNNNGVLNNPIKPSLNMPAATVIVTENGPGKIIILRPLSGGHASRQPPGGTLW